MATPGDEPGESIWLLKPINTYGEPFDGVDGSKACQDCDFYFLSATMVCMWWKVDIVKSIQKAKILQKKKEEKYQWWWGMALKRKDASLIASLQSGRWDADGKLLSQEMLQSIDNVSIPHMAILLLDLIKVTKQWQRCPPSRQAARRLLDGS